MHKTGATTKAALLPFFSLPAVGGGVLLILVPGASAGPVAVIAATVMVALYLVAGDSAARQISSQYRLWRGLRRDGPQVSDSPKRCWLIDRDGFFLRESAAGCACLGPSNGRRLAALLFHLRADPNLELERLIARVPPHGAVHMPVDESDVLELTPSSCKELIIARLAPKLAPVPTPDEFDRLPVALLRMDQYGHVRRANAGAVRLLGPIGEAATLAALVEGPGRPLPEWLADVWNGRGTGRAEMLSRRDGGQGGHLQVILMRNEQDLIAVLTDASEIAALQAQFVQSQKMQAIGQLAGGVAHDFNNLLTAITGYCDLLMLRRDPTDPDYADLDQISQNANRAASLVRQLLAFSRKQTMKAETLDLREVLSDLTHLLNRLVGERVTLTLEHDQALPAIRADGRQLEQVLMNLVVNARDAMPTGGEIKILTTDLVCPQAIRRGHVEVPSGRYAQVSVIDEGGGMSAETMRKIFEPFFTTKGVGEGTGLGLSTVYGIVKQTGGYVFCESKLGEGTRFDLLFPSAPDISIEDAIPDSGTKSANLTAALGDVAVDLRGGEQELRILLVEDETPVRAFAARALRLAGHTVIEAEDAEAALALLNDKDLYVDGFVTDVVMPGRDGISWVREALGSRPGTPVVFMSGYAKDVFSDTHDPIPCSTFLGKPFSLADLTSTVEGHIRPNLGLQHGLSDDPS